MRRLATTDAMLLACVLIWGLNYTVAKYVLTNGFHPLSYSVVRYGGAAVLFGVLTLALERTLRIGSGHDLRVLAVASAILAVNQLSFVYALHYTTAATVALIFGSNPIFASIFSALAGLERLNSRIVVAALASFTGVALVAFGSGGDLSADAKGNLLALAMSATWAAYSVLLAPLMRRYSPYRISAVVLVATWLPLLAIGARQVSDQEWSGLGWLVWLGLVYGVVGPLVLTNVLWFTAIDRIGPPRASLFANLQPFAAAVFALLLLDERLGMVQVAGGFAIGAGILLSRGPATPVSRAE